NGLLDTRILTAVVAVISNSGADVNFRTDFWCFSEGPVKAKLVFDDMEHGNPFGNAWFTFNGNGGGGIDPNITDLPPQNGGAASLQTGWGSGGNPGFFGGFGRNNPVHISDMTHFNLWINPDPGQDYVLEINLQEDDDGDNAFPFPAPNDDEFQYNLEIGPSGSGKEVISGGGWQLVSIPLAEFFDDNSIHGGNGVFDPVPVGSGGNGQLIGIVLAVISNSGADVTFRTDFWCFSNGPLELDCDPGLAVDITGNQKVYLGYAPMETTTLTASVTAAAAPVRYLWSTGETTESITVSPLTTTTYEVMITDATGCTSISEVTVCVVDVSCKNGKVKVCHKNKNNLCIATSVVADHLAHGDQLGTCGVEPPCESVNLMASVSGIGDMGTSDYTSVIAYPNPFADWVEFKFNVAASTDVKLEIVTLSGQKVATLYNGTAKEGKEYQVALDSESLPSGLYIYRFETGGYVVSKILVLKR
ncbi:MAG: T9SS type A sorting domain-containing protein, partial [Flavobacteriaceae bacterium]